jgi:hypothetical protein
LAAAAAFLAVAAILASAQEGPTGLQESKCWTCHKEGGTVAGDPLVRIVDLVPPASLRLEPGEPAPFVVTVRNPWLSELHRIVGTLDLSDAPSLGFEPPPDPVLGVKREGELALAPAGVNAERTADVAVPVLAGATDLRIRLVPGKATGVDAPNLELRLWPEGVTHDLDHAIVVDGAGKGGTETWRGTAETLSRLGYGAWTAQAAQRAATAGVDISALAAQPFEVVVDTWFNLTGDRTQLAATTDRLDGQADPSATGSLTWRLFVQRTPQPGEAIRIAVELVASYEHAPQFNAVDDWIFRDGLRVPIQAPASGGSDGPAGTEGPTTIVFNTTAPPADTAGVGDAGFWNGREWGEVVGYFTTFLMASALVSGGVLGGASRRGLNKLFRTAKRRIAFHNLTSYAILLAAAAHTAVFVVEAEFPWTLGLLWGGLGIVFLAALGWTGAWQIPLIRSWGYKPWRVVHYGCAILATVATLAHIALDGVHFVDLQQKLGWADPVEQWLP